MATAVLVIVPPIILGGFNLSTPRKALGVASIAIGGGTSGAGRIGKEITCVKASQAPVQQGETITQVWSG